MTNQNKQAASMDNVQLLEVHLSIFLLPGMVRHGPLFSKPSVY